MVRTAWKSFYWAVSSKSRHFLLFWCMFCTATPGVSSSSKNINSTVRVSRQSFRFLWLCKNKYVANFASPKVSREIFSRFHFFQDWLFSVFQYSLSVFLSYWNSVIFGFYYPPTTYPPTTDHLPTDSPIHWPPTHRPNNYRPIDKFMFKRLEDMKKFILQDVNTGGKIVNYTSVYYLFE